MGKHDHAYMCPVCGFDTLEEPPYSASGAGLHEICPCCGFQFGVTDDDQGISFHEWREGWIEQGMSWDSNRSSPPPGWNPLEQLSKLRNQANNVLNDSLFDTGGR
jgi:hypothetical protein